MLSRRFVKGSSLLEGLIAILIFSVGVLALMGMQANAINSVSEAKYRTDAAFPANQLLGNMWADAPSNTILAPPCPVSVIPSYAYNGIGVPPTKVADWVQTVKNTLPGATTFPPLITVTPGVLGNPGACGVQFTVTITIRYRPPKNTAAHRFVTTAVIS